MRLRHSLFHRLRSGFRAGGTLATDARHRAFAAVAREDLVAIVEPRHALPRATSAEAYHLRVRRWTQSQVLATAIARAAVVGLKIADGLSECEVHLSALVAAL